MASATVTKLFSFMSSVSSAVFCTATITSDSFPTPEGSMRMRSGWNWACTSFRALWKSPTREQQMHPADISLIWTPDSFRKPPSMLISPNSFSMSTSFSPGKASASSFLMRVVLPAPRKPETMSILVMVSSPLHENFFRTLSYHQTEKKQLPGEKIHEIRLFPHSDRGNSDRS